MQEKKTSVILHQQLARMMSERKVTQDDVAKATGLTQAALSNYVRGKRSPALAELFKLARFFGVSAEELTFGDAATIARNQGLEIAANGDPRFVSWAANDASALIGMQRKLRDASDDLLATAEQIQSMLENWKKLGFPVSPQAWEDTRKPRARLQKKRGAKPKEKDQP